MIQLHQYFYTLLCPNSQHIKLWDSLDQLRWIVRNFWKNMFPCVAAIYAAKYAMTNCTHIDLIW